MALAVSTESEPTFPYFDSGEVVILPINEQTGLDPRYTYPIIEHLLYSTPFTRTTVTQTFQRVLALTHQNEEEPQKAALEVIGLDDETLKRSGIIGKYLEVFKTGTGRVKESLLDIYLPQTA